MMRTNLPCSDPIRSLPYFAQTLLACRFLLRVTLSLFMGSEKAIAIDFCKALESISRDGAGPPSDDGILRPLLQQLHSWNPSQMAPAFVYARDAIESAIEGTCNGDESRISQLVILSLLNVYQEPRFSPMQLTILLSSDLAQLSFVCQEAKIGPWDGMTNYVLTRLTPCHALDLVEPPIALEDKFR